MLFLLFSLVKKLRRILFIFFIGFFSRYIILEYYNVNVFSEYTNVYSILYYFIMSIVSVLSFEIFSYLDFPNTDVNPDPKERFFTKTNYLASNQNSPEDFNTNDDENLELYEDYIKSQANSNNNTNVEDTNVEDTKEPTYNFNKDYESNSELSVDNELNEEEKINVKYSRRFDSIEEYKERNEILRSSEVKDVVKKLDAGEELNDEERDKLDAVINNSMDQHFSKSRRDGLHLYGFGEEVQTEITDNEERIKHHEEKLREYEKRLEDLESSRSNNNESQSDSVKEVSTVKEVGTDIGRSDNGS